MGPEAFKACTLEHGGRVYGYALWMLGDLAEAQDVTQESLLRLWMNRRRVVPAAARTWLLRTAHRQCIDRLRRAATRGDGHPRLASRVAAPAGGPEEIVAGREVRDAVIRGLDALPPRDRALILLREKHGLSYAEVAGVLDMPLGSIKAALHRARRRLRDELSALEVQP